MLHESKWVRKWWYCMQGEWVMGLDLERGVDPAADFFVLRRICFHEISSPMNKSWGLEGGILAYEIGCLARCDIIRAAPCAHGVRKVCCFSPPVATGPRVLNSAPYSPCWYTRDFLF